VTGPSFTRLAELMVQERAEEIVGVFFKAIESGDWRAAEALLMRVHGKPQEKLEVTHPQTVEDVEKMTLAEIQQLRATMKADGGSW
jgi:hypothetical protein